jgi:uncharacterized protein
MKVDGRVPAAYRRVVVDTNVILSAALSPDGTAARLLERLLPASRLVLSRSTFDELETRLWRKKFDPYLSPERRRIVLHSASRQALWLEPVQVVRYSRDPDDDKFIVLALKAKATRLITGDADLLCLDPLGDLRILTPRAALDEIEAADKS